MTIGAGWTEEREGILRKLWTDGHSAGQIATELGGTTRNAVCGKAHRLGLMMHGKGFNVPRQAPKPRSAAQKERRITQRLEALHTAEQPEAIDLPPDQSPDACTLMDLGEHSCRWPMGNPSTEEFRFCGSTKHQDFPYCARHSRLAYQPGALRPVSTWGTT